MKTQLDQLFSTPVFGGDLEKTWKVWLLSKMINISILVMALVIIGNIIGGRTSTIVFILQGIMIGAIVLNRALLSHKKPQLASILMLSMATLIIAAIIVSLGTIRTPATSGLMLIIIYAGMLLGKKGIVISSVVSSLVILGAILAENAGLLPDPDYTVTISQWISHTAIFGFAGTLIYYLFNSRVQILHQSEKKIRNLMESVPIGISVTTPDGEFPEVNQNIVSIFGYDSKDEFIQTPPDSLYYNPKDRKQFMELAKKNTVKGYTSQFRRKDGSVFWGSMSSLKVMTEAGETEFIITFEDITERKQAEQSLQESENRYRTLLNYSPDPMIVHDGKIILDSNTATLKALGLKNKSDLIGTDPFRYTHPKERERHLKLLETIFTDDKPPRAFEARIIIPTIGERDALVTSVPIIYNQKQAILINLHDITKRKRAEKGLSETSTILNRSHVSAFLWNLGSGKAVFVTDNVDKLTGYSVKEFIDGDVIFKDIIHEDDVDRTIEEIAAAWKAGDAFLNHQPYRLIKKNGDIIWVEDSTYIRRDSKGKVLSHEGIINDITSRIQAESKQQHLENQLRQSQKLEAIGTMVGGISHELNNVLQSMFLYGGIIKDKLPENEELQTEFQHLLNGAERAKDIVKQILTFSRKTEIDLKPQVLHEIILESLSLERASLPANIEILQSIDMNCGSVLCDKTQIHQIILNLCNNAYHAIGEKGGTLTVSLHQIHASMGVDSAETEVLELKISDTGRGMNNDTLGKLFDPFFTTKDIGAGTGLGLSVIHGIVDMMQGQISVSSELSKGTTFRILLPIVDTLENNKSSLESSPETDDTTKSILLVDDDDSIRTAAQTVLRAKGFTVECASDGEQALEVFRSNPDKYELIVTDLSMPKLSGKDLARKIRNMKSEVPIIISTGKFDIEDREEFKNIGITDVIQKPWTVDKLIECINDLSNY